MWSQREGPVHRKKRLAKETQANGVRIAQLWSMASEQRKAKQRQPLDSLIPHLGGGKNWSENIGIEKLGIDHKVKDIDQTF